LDKLDLDPAELTEVDERLNTLQRLMNKYGDTVDIVMGYRDEIGAKISDLEKQTDDLSSLQSK